MKHNNYPLLLMIALGLATGCDTSTHAASAAAPTATSTRPSAAPASSGATAPLGVSTTLRDPTGRAVRVPCATCHGGEAPMAVPGDGAKESSPHRDLRMAHGQSSCESCHQGPDYAGFHLADGRRIPAQDVVLLCGQCHGPQARDYRRGSHGGMRGYWDEKRGPKIRNRCTQCHDPHAPAIGQVMPAPGPKDRMAATRTPHHD